MYFDYLGDDNYFILHLLTNVGIGTFFGIVVFLEFLGFKAFFYKYC